MDYPVAFIPQLSAHLKAFRHARGLTQAELGTLIGVKQARVAQIEANPGSVSTAHLLAVLAALGVSVVLRDARSAQQDTPALEAHEPTPLKGSW